jgi:hypothetical protein
MEERAFADWAIVGGPQIKDVIFCAYPILDSIPCKVLAETAQVSR